MPELKKFTRAEIKKSDENITRIIIHDKVYDVKGFLNEHPGGEEVLLEQSGKDATEDWEDVGHSSDAQELMKNYLIGELIDEEKTNRKPKESWSVRNAKKDIETTTGPSNTFYTILIGIIAILFAIWYLELGA